MLVTFLRANCDVFAWKPADMPGVPKELIEHSLNVNPTTTPKNQRLRRFSAEKREAVKKELAKLLTVGFIKEVYHPEWLANPVLVLKKNNNEWRMCVNYIDLNKHCSKDPFGLPRIDQVIDSTAGCVLLSFLDCYLGCHQTALKKEDQIKMAFITPFLEELEPYQTSSEFTCTSHEYTYTTMHVLIVPFFTCHYCRLRTINSHFLQTSNIRHCSMHTLSAP